MVTWQLYGTKLLINYESYKLIIGSVETLNRHVDYIFHFHWEYESENITKKKEKKLSYTL